MAASVPNNSAARPGFPPTREDVFWVDTMRQVLFDSMTGMQKAAMLICWLGGVGLLGYLAWLLSPWCAIHSDGYSMRLLVLSPVVFWTLAVFHGALVFLVRRYRYFANSPDSSRLAFRRINRRKRRYLYRAFALWFLGVLAVLTVAAFR